MSVLYYSPLQQLLKLFLLQVQHITQIVLYIAMFPTPGYSQNNQAAQSSPAALPKSKSPSHIPIFLVSYNIFVTVS